MWSFSNANPILSLASLKLSVALRTKSPGPYLSSSISRSASGLSSPLYMQTLRTPPCSLTTGPVGPLTWRALATPPQLGPPLSCCLNTPKPSPGLCSLLDLHFSPDTHYISCNCFYEKIHIFSYRKIKYKTRDYFIHTISINNSRPIWFHLTPQLLPSFCIIFKEIIQIILFRLKMFYLASVSKK